VEQLNPDFAIERFAGEVPPRFLSVNKWGTIRYDVVLQKIIKEFEKRGSWQGKMVYR
jgi:radical SAM superfamily enzyme